jgi:hypothetical protein
MYDDVFKCVDHIVGGNKDGSVITRREMSEQIFPMLDQKRTGKISVQSFIDMLYSHEEDRHYDPMLATKALGGRDRPTPMIDPRKVQISKADGHRAEVLWGTQEIQIDSLEMSKIYGHDKFDSEGERGLARYLLDHYATGLTYVFSSYCSVTHGASKVVGALLFEDRASQDQIKYSNCSKLCHDFKIVMSRAKIEHFMKRKESPARYRPLPKGTITTFVWIDDDRQQQENGAAASSTVPRLSKTGSLPVTPIEMKEMFIKRTRHVMRWRKLDTASGLTSIASLALFFMDIAQIACARMGPSDALWERRSEQP